MKLETLSRIEWNFDSVPDNELVACCYWEYARESAFIRDIRRRSLGNWRAGSHWDKQLNGDLITLQGIGYEAEIFLRGFFFEPDIVYQSTNENAPNYRHPAAPPLSGSFPAPWQSLSEAERKERAHVRSARTIIPLAPISRGGWHDAQDIARWAEGRWRGLHADYEKVRRENPETSEVDLIKHGKLKEFPGIQPSLYSEGGSEITVVWINWSEFTNDELVRYFRRWVKANRPKCLGKPDARGHKPKDCRAQLTRLAVMRLLSRFTALQLVADDYFPEAWKTKQFSGRKWLDVTKWHDARREARRIFLKLFPFLPKSELPLSWKRPAPAK